LRARTRKTFFATGVILPPLLAWSFLAARKCLRALFLQDLLAPQVIEAFGLRFSLYFFLREVLGESLLLDSHKPFVLADSEVPPRFIVLAFVASVTASARDCCASDVFPGCTFLHCVLYYQVNNYFLFICGCGNQTPTSDPIRVQSAPLLQGSPYASW